ncbi:hypothetical protein [Nakamurella lactea]|uniref:hypothetical protein n=1 Tax=Nakamurella lactea TaxID=459515 RepID=UPI0003F7AB9E|nr:hypothetical protein [Nakamurella lactea]
MTISRRALLAAIVAVGGGLIAGCTGEPSPDRSPDSRTTTAPTPTTPTTSGTATTPTSTDETERPGATTSNRSTPATSTSGWESALLTMGATCHLAYAERDGLRLPDFGSVGYHLGRQPVPQIPAVHTVGPIRGDNTRHLQQAIDLVGALPPGPDGFRGALELRAGTYEVAGTVNVTVSGVVLRGAGDGQDPSTNTILRAVGNSPKGRTVVALGAGGKWDGEVPGSRTDLTSDLVPIGSSSISVASAAQFRPGNPVVIVHPCSREWLKAVAGGGTGDDPRWQVGSVPVVNLRHITDVAADRLTLDAPLFATLDRALSRSYLYLWDQAGLVTDVGVEHLRVDIVTDGPNDEEHAANGIRLGNVRDAWVLSCTVLHFVKAGIMTAGATRVTVSNCRSLDPVGRVEGGRRYNFDAEARSQLVLFTDCHAGNGRHSFIVNGGGTASGIVFHRTTATASLASSEGHRRWSQGLLFDNHQEIRPATDRTVMLGNRGDYGTSHGWAAVNSVAWNCDVDDTQMVVQQPPSAQNYAIGCQGRVDGDGPFKAPAGHIEGTDRRGLIPASLYEAQQADRQR